MNPKKVILTIVFILICLGYFFLGYSTPRDNFLQFILLYALLFAGTLFLFWNKSKSKNLNLLLLMGIAFRLVFLLATPQLSNDYYRFIWDGRLLANGTNPYHVLPAEMVKTDDFLDINQAQDLYEGMGQLSQGNYTCYPPINQLFFLLAALIAPSSILGSVVVMRLFIILFDIGTVAVGLKILKKIKLPRSHVLFYALNPLIIIELVGNLHFEGVMIFFLFVCLYFLMHSKNFLSAFFLALSASVKLIPLIFLPLFFKKLKRLESVKYIFIVGFLSAVLFLPFWSLQALQNIAKSLRLYIQVFEANASFYYLVRQVGYTFTGYNIIRIAGWILAALVVFWVIYLTLKPRNEQPKHLFLSMLAALTIYYLLSTTVHPWYIATLIALSVLTPMRFTIVWSLVIVLSYHRYRVFPYEENLWFIAAEYTIVYGYLIYEVFFKKAHLTLEDRLNKLKL